MVIYKKTFENTKTLNMDFPIEDQYYASEKEAIVADGITRDPIGISDFSSVSFEELLKRYPRPSGAELAAKTIVKTFSKSDGDLYNRLIKCNQSVKLLNDKDIPICDYLENDYYGAVASCVKIEENYLYYAFICDCGVIVYDKSGNVKFQTEDEKFLYSDPYLDTNGVSWNLPEARIINRKKYRNKLETKVNDKCVSYGALTGEEEAISFIRSGKIELEPSDIVIVYSDGFTEFLHLKEFIDLLFNFNSQKFEQYIEEISYIDYEKYGKEKTLVIMKK